MRAPQARRDGSYIVADDGLPVGSCLGGPDLCVTLKGDGDVEQVHSLAAGARLISGLTIHHWELSSGVHLSRGEGTFHLEPHAQTHRYRLGEAIAVEEVVAVTADQPDACTILARVRNEDDRPLTVASIVIVRLAADPLDTPVDARYDAATRTLVVWNRDDPSVARAVEVSCEPVSYAVTCDHARPLAERWQGPFASAIDTRGSDPLGILHLEHRLEPGDEAHYALRIVRLVDRMRGPSSALKERPAAEAMLAATRERYAASLSQSVVLSPSRAVDMGVWWAKANMLRVMREAPTGPGFSNDPARSNACVGRDAAWFVHGCDWLDPAFSLALLRSFAARQEPNGKIVEWYDLRSGTVHDDGLEVNDDTPLFVLGAWHHAAATRDLAVLAELYGSAAPAGEHLLRRRDDRGLVWCSSPLTGARGIVGWRNIIDGYRISGATTELNSEAFAALRRLASMATALGRDREAERWRCEAAALHTAIERHLRNPENGLYHLCIDVNGKPRSELSADLLFPVVFGVSDDATSARILTRLHEPDFWTAAGIRTVPRRAPQYSPSAASGLLGGVWVAVSFWYAFAAAQFVPDVMAEALETAFSHYARDPLATATVPGQFGEWLDGETLANRGIRLSPWFPPRYLWAAIEGACGLSAEIDGAVIAPKVPPGWQWIAARNVPLADATVSWVAVRANGLRVLATGDVRSHLPPNGSTAT